MRHMRRQRKDHHHPDRQDEAVHPLQWHRQGIIKGFCGRLSSLHHLGGVVVVIPERFVRALDVFEAVLTATPSERWFSPSPCRGWSALDVAGHVTAGLLVVQARAAGRALPEMDPDWQEVAGTDPVATWHAVRGAMMAVLLPEALARRVTLAVGVEIPLREWLEQYPLELLVHAWDLAQATGQVVVFDADLLHSALE